MKYYGSFASVKNSTFDSMLPPTADPARVGLVAAGNPIVLKSAHKRKRGGRVKITGTHPRHRLDRSTR